MADIDERLTGAFADFRNQVGPLIRPDGTDRAQTTVRSRRRRRTAAVAVAVLAVPVAAYATLGSFGDDRPAPPPPLALTQEAPGVYKGTVPVEAAPKGPAATYQVTLKVPDSIKAADVPGCRTGTEPKTIICAGTVDEIRAKLLKAISTSDGPAADAKVVKVQVLDRGGKTESGWQMEISITY